MNLAIDRELLLHGAVAVGVCIGAWMYVVKPRKMEAAALEHTIAETLRQEQTAAQATPEAIAFGMERLRERLSQVQSANALSLDTSGLYGRVMDLAERHQVQIQGVEPQPHDKDAASAAFTVTRLKMTVDGSFASIAQFLESASDMSPFIRPSSLQMTPTVVENRPIVVATFVLEALCFKIPDALASVGGDRHGQP